MKFQIIWITVCPLVFYTIKITLYNFANYGKDLLLKFFKRDLNSKKEENSENLNKISTIYIK
mgnify:FL=1